MPGSVMLRLPLLEHPANLRLTPNHAGARAAHSPDPKDTSTVATVGQGVAHLQDLTDRAITAPDVVLDLDQGVQMAIVTCPLRPVEEVTIGIATRDERERTIATESVTETEITTVTVAAPATMSMTNLLIRRLTATFPATAILWNGERPRLGPVPAPAGEMRLCDREAENEHGNGAPSGEDTSRMIMTGKTVLRHLLFTASLTIILFLRSSAKPSTPSGGVPRAPGAMKMQPDLPKPKLQFANLKWKPDNAK